MGAAAERARAHQGTGAGLPPGAALACERLADPPRPVKGARPAAVLRTLDRPGRIAPRPSSDGGSGEQALGAPIRAGRGRPVRGAA
jgi:hypothetical protein